MRLSWKAVVGVGVSAFFIWWVLRGEDPGQIVEQMSQANPWYFLASILVGTAGYFIRALRWNVLLQPVSPDTRLRSRFSAICIGFAVNNVFPARLGELARPFALSRVEPVTVSGAFGSLVVERFLHFYEDERQDDDETFNEFVGRQGKQALDAVLTDLTLPPEFNEQQREHFVDWERDRLYVLERGEGECAV